jgi:hypothetical protein
MNFRAPLIATVAVFTLLAAASVLSQATIGPATTAGQCGATGFVACSVTVSGGGGAITVADGADVALGSTADAAWSGSGSGTVVATTKYIGTQLASVKATFGAATAPTNGFGVLDWYVSSNPTLTTGQSYPPRLDVNGDTRVVIVDGNGGIVDPTQSQQIYEGYTYTNITTKTNTLLIGAAGHQLARIVINKQGTADTITIKDSAAADCSGGTIVGTITVIATATVYPYGITSIAGLCLVSGGTTAGDYTAVWR